MTGETTPEPSWLCLACRLHVHDRCDLLRGCECVVIGVDRAYDPPRIVLCPSLESDG